MVGDRAKPSGDEQAERAVRPGRRADQTPVDGHCAFDVSHEPPHGCRLDQALARPLEQVVEAEAPDRSQMVQDQH